MAEAAAKPILITIPQGNNPARIRLLIYLKKLEGEIDMKTPDDYGGLRSPEYRKLNPQGKIPVLLLPDGAAIYEARVITGYICDRWSEVGPSFRLATPEARARAALINQVHDLYIASANMSDFSCTATQGCLYKPPKQIDVKSRQIKAKELWKQLGELERLIVGPFCGGEEITEADVAMYPTFIMILGLSPMVLGWPEDVLGEHPKLKAWNQKVDSLEEARRVKGEMLGILEDWKTSGRLTPVIEQIKSEEGAALRWAPPFE